MGLSLVLAFSMFPQAQAHAQRRDGGAKASQAAQVTLKAPARFGDVVLTPRVYLVKVQNDRLNLLDAQSMVLAASLQATVTPSETHFSKDSAEIKIKAKQVVIVLRHLDAIYRVSGSVAEGVAPAQSAVKLKAEQQAVLANNPMTVSTDELTLVRHALKRYIKDIMPCADKAHRNRWTTDHPRFANCVCPLTKKWRMPKVKKAMRVHEALAKGKSGFSFAVTPEGRVAKCRVWTGSEPPEDEPPMPGAASQKGSPSGG